VSADIVFNPILPVHLEKDTWRVLDAGAGLAFLGVLWVYRKGVTRTGRNHAE